MQLLIGSPLGLWVLLGVPALLIIHALQRKTVRTPCSTLFLLDDLAPESVRGPVIDALRPSWLLALQLLAICLLCWLLIDPRWIAADSKRTVAIVLDGSISMSSFRERALAAVEREVDRSLREPGAVEWALIDSRRAGTVLYRGGERAKFRAALAAWNPTAGQHDFRASIRYGMEIAGKDALVVFVTDHAVQLPPSVAIIAVGAPTDNCGFAGAMVDGESSYRALVRNYGIEPCQRTVRVGGKEEQFTIAAGASKVLSGVIPAGEVGTQLEMNGDSFSADDTLTLIRPERKLLKVKVTEQPAIASWWKRLVATSERIADAPQPADAQLAVGGEELLGGNGNAIALIATARPGASLGRVFAEHHPLVDHLRWDDLRAVAVGAIDLRDGDEPLLWSSENPLVFLRPTQDGEQLVVNLTPESSTIGRNSSFILLIHRFIERIRSRTPGREIVFVETNQRLRPTVAGEEFEISELDRDGAATSTRTVSRALLSAPSRAGLFAVRSKAGEELLRGAAYFAEVVEADLREASAADTASGRSAKQSEQSMKVDPLISVWILLLLATLLGSWRCAAAEGVK